MNEATEIIRNLILVIEDFMPNIGRCALQDYQRLNESLIAADKFLKRNTPVSRGAPKEG